MPAINFLFWNICKNNLASEIVALVIEHDISVLVLAENEKILSFDLLRALSVHKPFYDVTGNSNKTQIFSSIEPKFFKPVLDGLNMRWSIKKLVLPFLELLIVTTHCVSKVNHDDSSQYSEAILLSEDVLEYEKREELKNTIVFGDFNMNPFENGMITAKGLHGTMDKEIALQKNRTVQNRNYEFFYNPMWSYMGDLSKGGVAGTYYCRLGKHVSYDWNIFDQVLIRPNLIPNFDDDYLDIITKTSSKSLLTKNGLIDKSISDHLPIKFSIKIN